MAQRVSGNITSTITRHVENTYLTKQSQLLINIMLLQGLV